jgi:meso-butanediol dehydrogenase/(S,S)-butanediol dehydrogenase/diacetyl reductase
MGLALTTEMGFRGMRGLLHKSAIVTGAGQGIGRGIALRLAREGVDVMVADLNPKTAAAVAEEITILGRRGIAYVTDVASASSRRAMIDRAFDGFGEIDILVNSAGIVRLTDPLDITEQEWDLVQAVNLKGTYFMCQGVLPRMLQRGTGCIVNVASIAGKVGIPADIHYNCSKAGVITLTRNLAMAYSRRGVRINCVCPGIVDTAMWTQLEEHAGRAMGITPEEYVDSRLKLISVGRISTPEDIANAVAFLCSDDASFIAGQAINVEGGMVFH